MRRGRGGCGKKGDRLRRSANLPRGDARLDSDIHGHGARAPSPPSGQGNRIWLFPSPRRGEGGERSEPGEGISELQLKLIAPLTPTLSPSGRGGARAADSHMQLPCPSGGEGRGEGASPRVVRLG